MYEVNGITFEDKNQAILAKKEAEGVKYVKDNTDMSNPDAVLRVYNKLINKDYFKTPVGLAFLRETRTYLEGIPYILPESILPLPGSQEESSVEGLKEETKDETKDKPKEKTIVKYENYKIKYRVALFFAIVFGVIILGMFTIVYYSSDNVTILNYENALQDKYASWEQELTQREAAVRQKEEELENGQD